jgi:N-methylhydantoinase A
MGITHQYEALFMQPLRLSSKEYLRDFKTLNYGIEGLEKIALRDMRAEGFSAEQMTFKLEAQMSSRKASFQARIFCPTLRFKVEKDIQNLCEAFEKLYGKGNITDEIVLERMTLKASCLISQNELSIFDKMSESPKISLKGEKRVFWDSGFLDTAIYEQKKLQHGNHVKGPAIIEGDDTTILIPKGWQYSVDKHLFGIIQRKEE